MIKIKDNKNQATHKCFFEGKLILLRAEFDYSKHKFGRFSFWNDDLEKWLPVDMATVRKNLCNIENINEG